MRLTLRTLLAYMDDVLDPADHEELERKIESSDFATELIHRSRDAVRRLRLGAPDLDAGEDGEVLEGDPGLSANYVAEYLDNTLTPEQVAEFERCCLETGNHADMRLAEVASCHHVLTMVLGEPADIRPEMRQRMYQIAGESQAATASGGERLRIEPAHSEPPPQVEAAPPVAGVVPSDAELDVPDYLRVAARDQRAKRMRRTVAIAALLVVGAGVGYLAWPTGEPDVSVVDPEVAGNLDSIVAGPEIGPEAGAEQPEASSSSPVTGEDAGEAPAWDAGAAEEEAPAFVPSGPAGDPTDGAPSVEESQEPATPDTDEASSDDALAAAVDDGTPASDGSGRDESPDDWAEAELGDAFASNDQTPPEEPEPPADYRDEADEEGVRSDASDDIVLDLPEMEEEGPPEGPAGETPAVAAVDSDGASPPSLDLPESDDEMPVEGVDEIISGTLEKDESGGAAEPAVDAGQLVVLGKYVGNDDLLLIYGSQGGRWIRLPNRTELAAGDRLLALPMFRSHIKLATIDAYLIDGAEVTLAAGDGGATSTDVAIDLAYGRLLLSAGLDGSEITLSVGDDPRRVSLGGSAELAIEVRRRFVPGEVAAQSGPLEVAWHLTSGTLTAGEFAAEAPALWKTVEGIDSAPGPFDKLPAWIDQPRLTQFEREARRTVSEALRAGEPVGISILELSDKRGLGRRREVRTLAAESGTYVGVFEPFVRALNDPDLNQLVWERQIEIARQALARDPRAAQRLREDFVAQRGEAAAADLMEMMFGFDEEEVGTTAEERKAGALPRLIRWLDSDQLDYRVLALYNLNQITGTRNQGNYRPTHTAVQRQRALRIYWDRLGKDELRPR